MAKESYIPQPGSLADRVCRFLQANPREELDVTDMVSKFGVVQRAIEPGLEAPMRHGLVVKGNDGAGSRLWKAGPKLAELGLAIPTIKQIGSPPPSTAAKSVFEAAIQAGNAIKAAKSDSRRGRNSKPLPHIDMTAITVRVDVPVPAHSADRKVGGKYDALFAKLDEAGHSIVVDIRYLGALKSAAKKYAKAATGAQFTVRKTSDGQCGVWRTK